MAAHLGVSHLVAPSRSPADAVSRFWGKHLSRRSPWEIAGRAGEETVYEVS